MGTSPSVDSASISGIASSRRMTSDAADLAEEMSGTKEKTLPAWMAEKVVLCIAGRSVSALAHIERARAVGQRYSP